MSSTFMDLQLLLCFSEYLLTIGVTMFHTFLFACLTIQEYLPVLLPDDC